MKKIVSLVAAACALAFVACDKPTESEPTLTVGSTSLTFEAVGSPAQNVGVTSNVEWKCTVAESAAAWLTAVKTDSGDGITVSVTDNGPEQRVGKITVEAVSAKVKAKEITVTQKAGEAVAVEFTLTPDKLEFVGESAPAQEVTVVLDGEGMTWKAAPEADGTWAHVEAGDGKFTVTVDDNPSTSPRATRIVVTPSDESVAAKSVTVTQNGKEIKPSLSVTMDPLECSFRYNDISVYRCNVEAVLTDWTAGTSDGAGNLVPWINLTVVNNDDEAYIGIGGRCERRTGCPGAYGVCGHHADGRGTRTDYHHGETGRSDPLDADRAGRDYGYDECDLQRGLLPEYSRGRRRRYPSFRDVGYVYLGDGTRIRHFGMALCVPGKRQQTQALRLLDEDTAQRR